MSPIEPILGIDLGTTYCAMAIVDEPSTSTESGKNEEQASSGLSNDG